MHFKNVQIQQASILINCLMFIDVKSVYFFVPFPTARSELPSTAINSRWETFFWSCYVYIHICYFFFIFHFQKQQWKVFTLFFWSFQVRMTSTFRYNSDNNLNWWWNLHFNVCISGFPTTALSSSSNNEMIWIPLICNEYNLCVAQYQTRL